MQAFISFHLGAAKHAASPLLSFLKVTPSHHFFLHTHSFSALLLVVKMYGLAEEEQRGAVEQGARG